MPKQDRKEQILDAVEDLLRRYGIAKTSVVDVAHSLALSHAAVYKHFPTKAALREAVAERWLKQVSIPLAAIAASDLPPEERLRKWVLALVRFKRRKVLDDPEMFAAYHVLAESADGAVAHHIEELQAQLGRIIEDGLSAGVFRIRRAKSAATAVLDATARFHHPHFVTRDAGRNSEKGVDAVLSLLIAGLKAGA